MIGLSCFSRVTHKPGSPTSAGSVIFHLFIVKGHLFISKSHFFSFFPHPPRGMGKVSGIFGGHSKGLLVAEYLLDHRVESVRSDHWGQESLVALILLKTSGVASACQPKPSLYLTFRPSPPSPSVFFLLANAPTIPANIFMIGYSLTIRQ